MVGCLKRTVILAIVLLLAGAAGVAWLTRDLWRGAPPVRVAASETSEWAPVVADGSDRVARQLAALADKDGPVYVNVAAQDLLAWGLRSLRTVLPSSTTALQARVVGGLVFVKGVVPLAELGGAQVLGPLARMLPARDTLEVGGVPEVRPGGAGGQLRITAIRIGTLQLPAQLIPPIVAQLRRGAAPAGLAADAIAIPLPPRVADLRVKGGKITLYRATP